ncbi:protein FAM162B-like [Heptranchias perlo]|uniref:protein FAM162B-like n=1 Tax=Heptranchias perlo TaxID=212740 RepID=UPI003559F1F9
MLKGLLSLSRNLLPAGVTSRPPANVYSRVSWQKPNPGRSLCTRVTKDGALKGTDPALPTSAPEVAHSAYKLQGRIPTTYDKKVLLWTGRFKSEQDIPEMVSIEMLYAARNKIRVKICYIMIGVSVLACLAMVVSGKKALKRQETLTKLNLEKKAQLKSQFEREHEMVPGKGQ